MNYTISIKSTLKTSSNKFVVAIYAASAPTVALQVVVPPKPYGEEFQVVFTDLNQQLLYKVVIWESATDDPEGLQRGSFAYKPDTTKTTFRSPLYLTADDAGSPGFVSGTSDYDDESMLGWSYWLESKGSGTMKPDVEYTDKVDTGGFSLLNGREIQPQEDFIVHFLPKIVESPAPQPNLISTGVTLTDNTTMDNTYVNKAIFLTGNSKINILPPLSSVVDFQVVHIYNLDVFNSSIRCSGTDKIQRHTQWSKIVLGKSEMLKLFKYNNLWYVDFVSPGVDMVGQFVSSYNMPADINVYPLLGEIVNRDVFERLTDRILGLNSGLVLQSDWATTDANGKYINKAKFGTGNGTTTLQLPDFSIYGYRRAVNPATTNPGYFRDFMFPDHAHDTLGDVGGSNEYGQSKSNHYRGTFTQGANGKSDLTGGPLKKGTGDSFATLVGDDNYPASTGELIFVRV